MNKMPHLVMTLWVTNGQCRALILLMAAEKDMEKGTDSESYRNTMCIACFQDSIATYENYNIMYI